MIKVFCNSKKGLFYSIFLELNENKYSKTFHYNYYTILCSVNLTLFLPHPPTHPPFFFTDEGFQCQCEIFTIRYGVRSSDPISAVLGDNDFQTGHPLMFMEALVQTLFLTRTGTDITLRVHHSITSSYILKLKLKKKCIFKI